MRPRAARMHSIQRSRRARKVPHVSLQRVWLTTEMELRCTVILQVVDHFNPSPGCGCLATSSASSRPLTSSTTTSPDQKARLIRVIDALILLGSQQSERVVANRSLHTLTRFQPKRLTRLPGLRLKNNLADMALLGTIEDSRGDEVHLDTRPPRLVAVQQDQGSTVSRSSVRPSGARGTMISWPSRVLSRVQAEAPGRLTSMPTP